MISILVGILIGIGLFTFHYAEGLSYFSTDTKACTNCHIMQPQFDSWQKASHHTSATCVDCHLPHEFIGKYIAKADNGYRHSKVFTFQDFHEPIMMSPQNSRILQNNCLRCHNSMVHGLAIGNTNNTKIVQCVHCHSTVGHSEKTGMGRFEKWEFKTGEHLSLIHI